MTATEACSAGESATPLVDGSRLRRDDRGLQVIASRCVTCGHLAHPAQYACSACGGNCELEPIDNCATVIVATQIGHARDDVSLRPPYQIVLATMTDGLVVRVASREAKSWAAGEQGILVPVELDTGARCWLGLQLVRAAR